MEALRIILDLANQENGIWLAFITVFAFILFLCILYVLHALLVKLPSHALHCWAVRKAGWPKKTVCPDCGESLVEAESE